MASNIGPEIGREMDEEESRTIHELAASGALAEAGRKARAEDLARGLPVTLSRGDDVIREYPDGRIEFVKKIGQPRAASR